MTERTQFGFPVNGRIPAAQGRSQNEKTNPSFSRDDCVWSGLKLGVLIRLHTSPAIWPSKANNQITAFV
jgi:hypothetical protein